MNLPERLCTGAEYGIVRVLAGIPQQIGYFLLQHLEKAGGILHNVLKFAETQYIV